MRENWFGASHAFAAVMKSQWIEFISSYCDSWCERCAFTERCSHFAMHSAITMCDGDVEAALQLTFGEPRRPDGVQRPPAHQRIADILGHADPTPKELAAIGREVEARQERMRRLPLAEASLDYAIGARRWLDAQGRRRETSEAAVAGAMEIVSWDASLIHAKIMRALNGRDEQTNGGARGAKKAVQSDWNGSAKVALLSLERSAVAWQTIAGSTTAEAAGALMDAAARLRSALLDDFPRAREFRRPGFDR